MSVQPAGGQISSGAAIELHAIAKRYGRRWALRGVSFRAEPGEVVGVVGHNGSGKSTLLRVLATLVPPTRGGGTIFGRDLVRDREDVRTLVGLLGHSPGIYDDLTARENLAFAVDMWGGDIPATAADAVLDRVGLGEHANERVRSYSSGMQRRVALARLLLRPPPVLLLDEPYNSFDVEGVALVDGLITETRERGGVTVLVAHDLGRGGAAIDRVEEMRGGTLEPASSFGLGGAARGGTGVATVGNGEGDRDRAGGSAGLRVVAGEG